MKAQRPTYINHHIADTAYPSGYDWCEIKRDGQWCRIELADSMAHFYSRNGSLIACEAVRSKVKATLLGEWMCKTDRAVRNGRVGLVYLNDCLAVNGSDLRALPLLERHAKIAGLLPVCRRFVADAPFGLDELPGVLAGLADDDIEGVVLKRSAAAFGDDFLRIKPMVTHDVPVVAVCGTGIVVRVGPGKTQVVSSGLSGDWSGSVGRVAIVGGWDRQVNGVIRHGVFMGWHPEKGTASHGG